MSTEATTTETKPFITPSNSSDGGNDIMKDIVLWKRKKLSTMIIVTATVTWVLMEVYQFNFLTLMSWLAIFVVASIFIYSNMLKLLGKEPQNLLRLELKEETAVRMAKTVRAWMEKSIKWFFIVSTKEDWPVFVGVMARLLTISYVGNCMDFLTFIYIGILAGMTLPLTYNKNEDKIKRFMDWLREKYKRFYEIIDEKAIKKIKNRILNENEKEKKIE
ncbi:seed maturation protein [Trifolium pratense]|uniref:Reticulon-like protein n=3 Tax=Trifolium pratense TaxID=57577 RepID=A0A2K3PL05_TRIPR|nr:seed maturation protein [Trifolium pratense]